jgi:hypothetical protein
MPESTVIIDVVEKFDGFVVEISVDGVLADAYGPHSTREEAERVMRQMGEIARNQRKTH